MNHEVPAEDLVVGVTFGTGVVYEAGVPLGALQLRLRMDDGSDRTVWFALNEESANDLGRDVAIAILDMLAKVDRAQLKSN